MAFVTSGDGGGGGGSDGGDGGGGDGGDGGGDGDGGGAAAATAVPAVGWGVARIFFFLANYFPFSEGSKGGWTLGANTPFAFLSFLPPKNAGGCNHPP